MDKGALGAIYWKLHASFLKNDRQTADKMLGMLMHEANNSDFTLSVGLGDIHFERFYKIRSGIRSGNYGRLYGQGIDAPQAPPILKKDLDINEREFHRIILSEKKSFLDCIGASRKASIVHEMEMDPYGRCDMLVRDGRVWHVVEVKIGEAPTAVVSQIDKYIIFAELQMCLGLHDEVKATVIAQTFPPYVTSELSRISVKMIEHKGTADSLRGVT